MSDTTYNKTKLEHLTDYIVSHLNSSVLDNKIEAWQERAAIVVDGEDRGNGGHIAAYWRYEAIISIEEFPHRLLDPRNVFALLACWLADYDRERDIHELDDPEITVDVINEESADVLIEIEMMEPIEMIPDEQGLITWRNKKYRVQAVPIDVAEEYELSNEN
ncbi:phage tail protein [Vibrio alginolyticus]|uniref:phage tail protein n=1 Tax=Vibrio TaxID=662 RepID=UPI0011211F2C|nr:MULTISPECIES: phage tail protein [Vibrio]EIE5865649.1 phage tail protein [Vibrio alginolyticus]EJU8775903.1 phage tail protein [Vibrio parahaemolyticus]EKA5859531.1 phage tail protein [Vibrio alginolyticus]MCR9310071.1 phage tail protein [Vibrio diabolicus]MCS0179260.1 phage tail protein [Vibrio alginolyticus]